MHQQRGFRALCVALAPLGLTAAQVAAMTEPEIAGWLAALGVKTGAKARPGEHVVSETFVSRRTPKAPA